MQKDFTKQAAKVLETARALAKKWNHPYVGTEHLLLALRREFTGVAGQILAANKVEEEKITKVIEDRTYAACHVKRCRLRGNKNIGDIECESWQSAGGNLGSHRSESERIYGGHQRGEKWS